LVKGARARAIATIDLKGKKQNWLLKVNKMDFSPLVNLLPLVIQIVVAAVVLAPILWFVGKLFVGKKRAKFTDAVWIGILGVVIGAGIGFWLSGVFLGTILGTLIMIIVWVVLTSHFFDCGLFAGLVIAGIAGIIYMIVSWILSAILVALELPPLPSLW